MQNGAMRVSRPSPHWFFYMTFMLCRREAGDAARRVASCLHLRAVTTLVFRGGLLATLPCVFPFVDSYKRRQAGLKLPPKMGQADRFRRGVGVL